MGASESSEEKTGTGLGTAILRLKMKKNRGEITDDQYDLDMKALLATNGGEPHESESEGKRGKENMEENIPACKDSPTTPEQQRTTTTVKVESTPKPKVAASDTAIIGEATIAASPDVISEMKMKNALCAPALPTPQRFEDIELGEGGLAMKIVRLKKLHTSAAITTEHFEWMLKRLLRVRAFGCPGNHELIRSSTPTDRWICNVCEKPLPLQSTVFSCRECDWDGCKDCLKEAQRTAAAEIKYDWWGEEEEEKEEGELVEAVRFQCPSNCGLSQTRTTSNQANPQFTFVTSTIVQILTPEALRASSSATFARKHCRRRR